MLTWVFATINNSNPRTREIDKFFSTTASVIVPQAEKFSQLDTANLAWAFCASKDSSMCSHSGVRNRPVHSAAKDVIANFLKVRNDWTSPWAAQNLAVLTWSAARSGACSSTTLNRKDLGAFVEGVTSFLEVVKPAAVTFKGHADLDRSDESSCRENQAGPVDVATLYWGIGSILADLAETVSNSRDRGHAEHVLQQYPPRLLRAADKLDVRGFTGQALANISWSLAKLGGGEDSTIQNIANDEEIREARSTVIFDKIAEQALRPVSTDGYHLPPIQEWSYGSQSILLWSFAQSGYYHGELFGAMRQVLIDSSSQVGRARWGGHAVHWSQILWSFGRLGHGDDELFKHAVLHVTRALEKENHPLNVVGDNKKLIAKPFKGSKTRESPEVVYESSLVRVVGKPPNWSVLANIKKMNSAHNSRKRPENKNEKGTKYDLLSLHTMPTNAPIHHWLNSALPGEAIYDDRSLDFGIVHRLDAETSGPILTARTLPAWHFLRLQFEAMRVRKTYVCLVHGDFSQTETDENGAVAVNARLRKRGKGNARSFVC